MYLEIFLADVAVFRVLGGILRLALREISEAPNIIRVCVQFFRGI